MRTALVAAALLAAAPTHAAARPGWTLAHARAVLAAQAFTVTDTSQADTPEYDLRFTRGQARSLRRSGDRFVFAGRAHDLYTDADVQIGFTFARPGRIVGFRGPAADISQPSFPVRATFYYAWYPEAWTRLGVFPYSKFFPSLSFYSADDATVVRDHTEAMRYAHLDAAIYSWWGPSGYPPTDVRFWRYLAAARTTPFRWAIYYEREGYEDPPVAKIRSDLEYVRDRYASKPAYLKVDGRFVVYVYANGADGCDTAARWAAANTVGAYVVLSGFGGWAQCPWQPQAWHQYSADREEYSFSPTSFMISPAFDEAGQPAAARPRDLDGWRRSIADMVATQAPWQLVISFNEWPEGTSVESGLGWETASGFGAYLDALHDGLPPRS
jgi:Glycosyl hydrolase family 99